VLLVLAVGCGSREPERPPAPPPSPVAAAIDAPAIDAMPAPIAKAVDLGEVGEAQRYTDGVRMLLLSGEHVYWSTVDESSSVTVRRMPRVGGAVETLGTTSGDGVEDHRNFALLGDKLAVLGSANARSVAASRGPVFELAAGKRRELARGPAGTIASTGLLGYDGKLYWTARGTTGSGPLVETTAKGATRTVLCEASDGFGCEHHVLDGTPPLASDGTSLWRIGARVEKLKVTCPDCTEPRAAVGADRVLCTPTPAGDAPSATCRPVASLVALDGSGTVEVPGATDVQLAAGRHYLLHADGHLARRTGLDGKDEVFAAGVALFTADDRGVAWVGADRHLWVAPHGVAP
jgi:hypothetical protein